MTVIIKEKIKKFLCKIAIIMYLSLQVILTFSKLKAYIIDRFKYPEICNAFIIDHYFYIYNIYYHTIVLTNHNNLSGNIVSCKVPFHYYL